MCWSMGFAYALLCLALVCTSFGARIRPTLGGDALSDLDHETGAQTANGSGNPSKKPRAKTKLDEFVTLAKEAKPGDKAVVAVSRSHSNPEIHSVLSLSNFRANTGVNISGNVSNRSKGLGSSSETNCYQSSGSPQLDPYCVQSASTCAACSGTWMAPSPSPPSSSETQCYQSNGSPQLDPYCVQSATTCAACGGTWQGSSGPSPSSPSPPSPPASDGGIIKPDPTRENNYFMVIGDWGIYPDWTGDCQRQVAQKMKDYATSQAAAGKTLIAIVSTGDNFYWTGVRQYDPRWQSIWADVYGVNDPSSPLYNVPWLISFGNHDYGTDDPQSLCGDSNQLSSSPYRPSGTDLFYMPAYNYYIDVPEIGLEFISVDTNEGYMGGKVQEGASGFESNVVAPCGGVEGVMSFLQKNTQQGNQLLMERAAAGTATTTVLFQHYPDKVDATYNTFNGGLNGRSTNIASFSGHTHKQACLGGGESFCYNMLSGGGGGCCSYDGGTTVDGDSGFAAVHLTSDGSYTTVVASSSVIVPAGTCSI